MIRRHTAEESSHAWEEEPQGTETGRCSAAAISCLAVGHGASGNAVSLSQIGKHRPRESKDTQDEKRDAVTAPKAALLITGQVA